MEQQCAWQRAAAAAVGKLFKAGDASAAPAWRLRFCSDVCRDVDGQAGADVGRFPALLFPSAAWTPSCAGCGAGLAWSAWWGGRNALPGRGGAQLYALCGSCGERDASFKDVFCG